MEFLRLPTLSAGTRLEHSVTLLSAVIFREMRVGIQRRTEVPEVLLGSSHDSSGNLS